MFKLLTRLFSNNSKPPTNEEESFFDLRIRINQELLTWLLAALLGGGSYVAIDRMSPSNAEPHQRQLPEQPSLVQEVE